MADAEDIEAKEAGVFQTPAVAGINGPIGTAMNVDGESPADNINGGTMEVTTRSSDNDDGNSSAYAKEIVDMIAIGSVVSPIRSPDIITTQEGGEYETTVNKRNELKQRKREASRRG